MEGTPFGHYRLMELLGRGGMGEVWQAFDTTTDRVVALKVLPAHLTDDATFQERFRREARAAAGLNEPHVVPIHGFGELDGRLYLDMGLVAGRGLDSILSDGPLAPRPAVMIVEQVASALQAAHDIGLTHRAVKPSNILVTKALFAYVIDFALAPVAGESDHRSDVYALTCVLHHCLTGQQAADQSTPPPRPSVVAGLPQRFDDVIASGMAEDPADRFSTTTELAQAAREALDSPPRPVTRGRQKDTPKTQEARQSAAPTPAKPKVSTAPAPRPRATRPAAPRLKPARPSGRTIATSVVGGVALVGLVLGIAATAARFGLSDGLGLLLSLLPAILAALGGVGYALVTQRR